MKQRTLLLMLLASISLHVQTRCTQRRYPEPERKPAIYVYEPFHERRYMLEADAQGNTYICEQALFNTQGFITVPEIYCQPGQPLVTKNPRYIPYDAQAWFNGKNTVIVELQTGALKGFTNVRACTEQPPGDATVLGATKQAHIIFK